MTEDYLYQHVLVENKGRQEYKGEPVFISEYGGIKWSAQTENAWGYGNAPESVVKPMGVKLL